MQWQNEPSRWKAGGGLITVYADPGTDTWREPKEGGIRDSGHFYCKMVEGDFTAEVKVAGEYVGLYDQAGLMVRAGETNWMKCGIEYVHGIQHASAVITREWSDWSILALDNPPEAWFRVTRQGKMLYVYYSLDGDRFSLMRKAYFGDFLSVDTGIMIASPQDKGFRVVFEDLKITSP